MTDDEWVTTLIVSTTAAIVSAVVVFLVMERIASGYGNALARRRWRQFEEWAKRKGRPATESEYDDWWKRGAPPPWEVDPNDSDEPTRQS